MSGVAVRAADWPHGLKCGQCRRILADGDRYAERLMSMAGNIPVVMIVCVECDTVGMSAQPVCGEDFCDRCSDCLACYGGEDCWAGGVNNGEHTWDRHAGHDVCPSCGRSRDCGGCRDCDGQHKITCEHR